MRKWIYLIPILGVLSCQKEKNSEPIYFPELMEIPKGFPKLVYPEDNEFSEDRWALGKKLFFDPIMSADSSISCSSCHLPELAFSDNVSFSNGVENRLGNRNAPSLANVAYHPYFLREGGVPTLEMQILVPLQEHNEFNLNIVLLAERLQNNEEYLSLAQKAYNREPDAFVITRAIANFERSLLSGNSLYDKYANQNQPEALSDAALNGMNLFFSERTNCFECHGGFNFTNYAFENNGLYEQYDDPGRFRLTGEESDIALFKVPSLRNVELTAPYMHDGSIETLEQVIEHYQNGGQNHPHKNPLIKALELTESETEDLIAFLNSLTDETFITNPLFAK